MAIKITKQPDIHLTASQLKRYRAEYEKSFRMYTGTLPDFEDWVRAKLDEPFPVLE